MIEVFLGPTLDVGTARAILPASYRPPAARGDLAAAVARGARAIALIDGSFEWSMSVWHKEILWALSNAVHVFGAASIGALRAAELAPFGMVGVGVVFEAFRDGALTADDEVAVVHEPGGRYTQPCVAMVDIRATVAKAVRAGVIGTSTADAVVRVAKSSFYPSRTYARILVLAAEHVDALELQRLRDWLPTNRVEQKRLDAIALLEHLRIWRDRSPGPHEPNFTLNVSPSVMQLADGAWESIASGGL
jgi:hypothetical protein